MASYSYKMVIVVRKDLKLSPGKMAAQVAHAAVNCALIAKKRSIMYFDAWYNEGQKKAVLKVNSLQELHEIKASAEAAGLVTSLIDRRRDDRAAAEHHDMCRHRTGAGQPYRQGHRPSGADVVKQQVRVLGIDDAPFSFGDRKVPIVGVVVRLPAYVEGVMMSEVTVDGDDADRCIIDLHFPFPLSGADKDGPDRRNCRGGIQCGRYRSVVPIDRVTVLHGDQGASRYGIYADRIAETFS